MNAYGAYGTIENCPALSFERRLSHPVEVVWRAITASDELEPLTGSGDACLRRVPAPRRPGGRADPGRVRNNHAPWIWVSKSEP